VDVSHMLIYPHIPLEKELESVAWRRVNSRDGIPSQASTVY
jgi:hypothetical protein